MIMPLNARPIDVFQKIVELIDAGDPLAVALVLSTQGSTPQRAGARAIIEQSGRLWGTVGGGQVEARTLRMAAEACRSQCPGLLEVEMTNDDAAVEARSAAGGCGCSSIPRSPAIARPSPRQPTPWQTAAAAASLPASDRHRR